MIELSFLNEFNPALVYGFQPESSPEREPENETILNALIPEAQQHQDMFDAYLYAQEIVLPVLRTTKDTLAETQLLDWIKTLHGFMGNSLMKTMGEKAGLYTQKLVFRWHQGSMLNHHLIHYFSNVHTVKNDKQLARLLAKELNVNYKDIFKFIKLLHKLKSNNEVNLDPSQADFLAALNPDFIPGATVLHKLATAYHHTFLTEEEKKLADKIVKICMPPSQVSGAMEAYATKTIANLKQCRTDDLDQICSFLAESFYDLTEIHPFGNANGRVATCLMNIFLRHFNLPSILLREVGQRNVDNTDYAYAIAQIDKSIHPLKELIKKRVIAAQSQPSSDNTLKQLVLLRVELSNVAERILQIRPGYNLELLRSEATKNISSAIKGLDTINATIIFLKEAIRIGLKTEEHFNKQTQSGPYSLTILSNEQKQQLSEGVEKLTECPGWKVSQTKGLVVWAQFNSEGEAKQAASKIMLHHIADLTVAQRADKKEFWVVKCDNIQFQKLVQLTMDKGEKEEISSSAQLV